MFVINRGPYAVADDYLHLQMFPDKCFSLNTRQLERHLKTFYDKYLEEMYICRMRVVIPTMMLKGTYHPSRAVCKTRQVWCSWCSSSFPLLFFLIRKIPLWKYVLRPVLSWLKATREGHITLYSQKVGE